MVSVMEMIRLAKEQLENLSPGEVAAELERDEVVYVRRGQGTFVADGAIPKRERTRLLRAVATRAMRDANRHGFTTAELIAGIREEEST